MNYQPAAPKEASAVILLDENSRDVFLAQRNPQIAFLGGFHAFPGGKTDAADAEIEIANCTDENLKKAIVAAVRETFEEIGVLLVRGGERLTGGQRLSLRDDLISGRFSFAEILQTWDLHIDGEDFHYTGFWTTPEFSPVRFRTSFFLARCPRKQKPEVFGEFVAGEFIAPEKALRRWKNSEILISPPVLLTLQTLAKEKFNGDEQSENESNFPNNPASDLRRLARKLLKQSQAKNGKISYVNFHPFVSCFPVRTETLPPATHTNCFIAGGRRFVVIDPASPFAEEQEALHAHIDSLIASGGEIEAIVLTHLHRDHVSGALALQKHLREKFSLRAPVAAHRLTAEALKGFVEVEKFIEDGEIIELEIDNEETLELRALHTPGHARGHLCFYDEKRGFLFSGDNVVGAGSVLIAPPEGNMKDYLNSLERMKNLPNLRFLCGSHGAAVFDARGKIESYIAHRLEREKKILEVLARGAKTPVEIVEQVYTDVAPELRPLAEKSVAAHLEKIENEKR
jgi:Zn-dependent hydrolases, including glyoxylases